MKARFAHNEHDVAGSYTQWGGTGVISQGDLQHHSMASGSDPSGLGRWTWSLFRGKGDIRLRVVSIYRPCENKDGKIAVYTQQLAYFQSKNKDRNPCTAFLEDLKEQLTTWLEQGDQIVVGGDVNESIFDDQIDGLFQEIGMQNAIFSIHPRENAPTTYYRTESGRIVDGLWSTPGLTIQRGGYLEPRDFPGNHSMLWVDISLDDALGHNPPRRLPQQHGDSNLAVANLKIDISRAMKS